MWKTTKIFKRKQKIMPPLKVDDKLMLTALEKSEALADQFEFHHQNPLAEDDPVFTKNVANKVETVLSQLPHQISPN
jgi:uncharacterized protein YkwD